MAFGNVLSNALNDKIWPPHYKFDPARAVIIQCVQDRLDLPKVERRLLQRLVLPRRRNQQNPQLLERLAAAIRPCRHAGWLAKRHITDLSDVYAIDYEALTHQETLDLHLRPGDHILDEHGDRPIDGPVFLDVRGGQLVGACVRNVAADLAYAAAAKYTFSNYGWHLWGYDLYEPSTSIYLVEGVFDAIAMRANSLPAVALGSAWPTAFQLACLSHKFKSINVCFDNDFWGHYGAYMAAQALRAPVLIPKLKDVSCYYEANVAPELMPVTLPDLKAMLLDEIAGYNAIVASGADLIRDLPYN